MRHVTVADTNVVSVLRVQIKVYYHLKTTSLWGSHFADLKRYVLVFDLIDPVHSDNLYKRTTFRKSLALSYIPLAPYLFIWRYVCNCIVSGVRTKLVLKVYNP